MVSKAVRDLRNQRPAGRCGAEVLSKESGSGGAGQPESRVLGHLKQK